ncbi:hypothetical protein BDC45DRAFT_498001 [Circinella umbellata]|nr:hypothetical protein BDC45DRAFT_498001 [Circinella umbellata]
MREPNMSLPTQNRAAVCITSALYDRRALDCTATLPMINSLTHLAYLTSTSPRIREILVLDGGLEQLVRILSNQDNHQQPNNLNVNNPTTTSPHDLRLLCQWSLAFQCVVNIGVRGTEQIRTRVVEAGMINIVLKVFQNFLQALEAVTVENEQNKPQQPQQVQQQQQQIETKLFAMDRRGSELGGLQLEPNEDDACRSQPQTHHQQLPENKPTPRFNSSSSSSSTSSSSVSPSMHPLPTRRQVKSPTIRRTTFPYMKISPEQRRRNRKGTNNNTSVATTQRPSSASSSFVNMFYREEDILMSLQLLAYLSKYPHIRQLFYTAYDINVFSIVEKFTRRAHPHLIQYWAGVIMRNACRKDETQGGIRRCANMRCGKWEKKPREFAKCRRCRKAKYCSKACQSVAWSDGHRWWCVERPSSAVSTSTSTTTNNNDLHVHHHQHQHHHNHSHNTNNSTTTATETAPSSISTTTNTTTTTTEQQPSMHH